MSNKTHSLYTRYEGSPNLPARLYVGIAAHIGANFPLNTVFHPFFANGAV